MNNVTTNDIGMAISDALDLLEGVEVQASPGEKGAIYAVNADDPSNIGLVLENGQRFVIRVIAQ